MTSWLLQSTYGKPSESTTISQHQRCVQAYTSYYRSTQIRRPLRYYCDYEHCLSGYRHRSDYACKSSSLFAHHMSLTTRDKNVSERTQAEFIRFRSDFHAREYAHKSISLSTIRSPSSHAIILCPVARWRLGLINVLLIYVTCPSQLHLRASCHIRCGHAHCLLETTQIHCVR